MDVAWMAWTWQTAICSSSLLAADARRHDRACASAIPETERFGVLGIPTTRGDRLFMSLLGAAFIHLAWIGLVGADTHRHAAGRGRPGNFEPWLASLISLAYAAAVFRWV